MRNIKKEVADFISVARLSGIDVKETSIHIEQLRAPHQPPKALPKGKMAVYIFFLGPECLKVGKVGPKSQARYTSQHYNSKSSNSNLAKSILKDRLKLGIANLSDDSIGKWIKTNTDRVNILLSVEYGISVLTLLESFLQCRLKPRFVRFDSPKA